MSREELLRISDYLGVSPDDHDRMPFSLCRGDRGQYVLDVTGPCFFFDQLTKRCAIYEVRPACCRNFPFKAVAIGFSEFGCLFICPSSVRRLQELFSC